MRRLPKILASIQFFLFSHASGFMIGNPAQPALITKSLVKNPTESWSLRIAYLDDYVYSQHVQNEFDFGPSNEKPPVVTFSTDAAQITLNLWKRVDLYGILGSSQMQMDQEIYTRGEFAWGVGGKLIIYAQGPFRFGCDLKYFQSNQNPLYLDVSGMPLNIVSDWILRYEDMQAALGISYEGSLICPYVDLSYIITKIGSQPYMFLVEVPGSPEPSDASIHSFDGRRRWGMAVGGTLLIGSMGTLAIESRFFNQNGINASLEFRF